MKVRVLVYPRREILDPQGHAIQAALARGGFQGVRSVRAGKSFLLELESDDPAAAKAQAASMAEDLLSNPVVEDYVVEVEEESRP